jgi:hypothetical protein
MIKVENWNGHGGRENSIWVSLDRKTDKAYHLDDTDSKISFGNRMSAYLRHGAFHEHDEYIVPHVKGCSADCAGFTVKFDVKPTKKLMEQVRQVFVQVVGPDDPDFKAPIPHVKDIIKWTPTKKSIRVGDKWSDDKVCNLNPKGIITFHRKKYLVMNVNTDAEPSVALVPVK